MTKIGLVLPEICPKTRFNMLYRFNKLNRFDKFNSKIKPVTGWTGLTRLTSLSTSCRFEGFQDFSFFKVQGVHMNWHLFLVFLIFFQINCFCSILSTWNGLTWLLMITIMFCFIHSSVKWPEKVWFSGNLAKNGQK